VHPTERPGDREATITVLGVKRQGLWIMDEDAAKREGFTSLKAALTRWPSISVDVWVIHFARGDQTEIVSADKDLYLADRNLPADYTTQPARAMRGEPPVLDKETLKRYAKQATGDNRDREAERRRKALAAIGELQEHAKSPTARKKLRHAANLIEAIDQPQHVSVRTGDLQ
jgi:hypothetical protein